MECAIFCLLVLWVFQIVFADHSAKGGHTPYIPRTETTDRLEAAIAKSEDAYLTRVNAMKPKSMRSAKMKGLAINCLTEAGKKTPFEDYKRAMDQCDNCYNKGDQTKKIKVANKCCDAAAAIYIKGQKSIVDDSAIACVKKCLKPRTNCKKAPKN